MAVSVRASVLLTTTVSSLFLPCVAMAATSDAENAALRREIAAMHREMMGEIHRLQARVDKYEHVSSLQSHRVGRVPRTLTAGSADDAQPQTRLSLSIMVRAVLAKAVLPCQKGRYSHGVPSRRHPPRMRVSILAGSKLAFPKVAPRSHRMTRLTHFPLGFSHRKTLVVLWG